MRHNSGRSRWYATSFSIFHMFCFDTDSQMCNFSILRQTVFGLKGLIDIKEKTIIYCLVLSHLRWILGNHIVNIFPNFIGQRQKEVEGLCCCRIHQPDQWGWVSDFITSLHYFPYIIVQGLGLQFMVIKSILLTARMTDSNMPQTVKSWRSTADWESYYQHRRIKSKEMETAIYSSLDSTFDSWPYWTKSFTKTRTKRENATKTWVSLKEYIDYLNAETIAV